MLMANYHLSNKFLGVAITDVTCLIMNEVDGMSAGYRGGELGQTP